MSLLTPEARGVYVVSVTPFEADGGIDFAGIDRLVEFYADHGVHGMTILGMMGEASKLTDDEQRRFAKATLRAVSGRFEVIVGVSAPGFATMSGLADSVMADGAAGVVIAPPQTVRGDDAARRYFAGAVEAIGKDTPFVIQDFPLATGVVLSAQFIQELAETYANCVMLKHEDWPGLDKISALRAMHAQGRRRISILTGNGGLFLPHEIERGADGAMTGFAYPELLVQICSLMAADEVSLAFDLFDAYLPLIRYEQQPAMGLPARKYVLQKRGAIMSRFARSPVPALSDAGKAELDQLMARLERRLDQLR